MDDAPAIKRKSRKKVVTFDDIRGAFQEIIDDAPTLLKQTVRVAVPDFDSIRRKILGNQTFPDGKSIVEQERKGYRF